MRESIIRLEAHLKAVQSKRPGWAVGLWGEAGVGKTFTVQTLLRESSLKSLSLHATTPEWNLVSAIPNPGKLPAWAEHAFERLLEGQAVKAQTLLDALVASLSGLAPLVLHLEDLHEASPERVEFIQNLGKAICRTKGVGLIVTSRSEPAEPFKNYRLEPLDKAASDGLLESLAKSKLPSEALDWVFARTKGNPLFCLEFWRYLVRQGFFWSDGESWHWRTPPDNFVPVSVEALISQAIDNADPASQTVLEARAIFPSGFDEAAIGAVWAKVAGVEPEVFLEAKKYLETRSILVGHRFIHPLFQEVVWRETLVHHKQSYAGRAIEVLKSSQPEQAAEFLSRANLSEDQALELLGAAAARATERGDDSAKGRWLAEMVERSPAEERAERALRSAQALKLSSPAQAIQMAEIAASALPPDPEAIFLLVDLLATQGYIAEAEARMRRLPWSEEVALRWWETQISVATQGAQWPRVVELWNLQPHFQTLASPRARIMIARGLVSMRQLELAQQLLDTLPEYHSLDSVVQMMVLNVQGQLSSYRGDSLAALEYNQKIIDLSRASGSVVNMIRGMLNYATDCKNLGLYEQIKPVLEEAKQLASQVGDLMMYAVVLMRLSDEEWETGNFESAETLLLEGQNLLQRHHALHFLNECQNKLARLYLIWQPPYGATLALKHARTGVSFGRQSQDAMMWTSALSYLARAECLSGNPRRGLEVAKECLEQAQEKGISRGQAWLAYGLALEATGQKSEAREAMAQALKVQKEPMLRELFSLEAHRMDGNIEQARKLYDSFVGRGLMGLAHVALRYFPQLSQDTTPAPLAQPSSIQLKVLGSVVLEQFGQALPIRAKKRLEVLAYLLEARIAGRTEVGILELIDMFYSDMPEERAKLTLRQVIYLIRTNLGAESIQSTPTGYALGSVDSDIEAFLKSGDSVLWRGAYLQGLSDGWNANVRDGLLLALRSSAEELLSSDPIEATRLGQIWLEMEPYDHDALRLTVQALKAQGNHKAAERTYKQGQERLSEVGERLPERLEEFLNMVAA